MALSNDLVSQFAKLTNTKNENKETTVKATYVQKVNGVSYVRLDGANSDILTPVKTTVDAEPGDKVSVLIKDHAATIIGNISSPSARSTVVENLREEVDEQGNTIQQLDNVIIQQENSIIQMNNNINQQQTTINQHDTRINQQGDTIVSLNNTIIQQNNNIDSMNNTIVEHDNQINSIGNTIDQQGNIISQHNNIISQHDNRITQNNNNIVQQGNVINQQGDQITSINNVVTAQGNIINLQNDKINIADSNIQILNSGFNIVDGVLTGLSSIVVNDLKTNTLNTQYAKIDFANIDITAIRKVFADSGIIKDLVVQEGHITGELVGVTIKGDLIEAGTLKADKLVVRGSNGLYYKLNIDGMDHISTEQAAKFILTTSEPTNWSDNYKDYYIISNNEYIHVTGAQAPTWAANTYYKLKPEYESGLDGTTIVAHTITADKISVTDLVAFGATIGGFDIDNNSIHSHTKTSINSDANGVYIGNDGQMYLGDQNNKIKYYKDNNNQWHLDISANSLKFSSHSKTIAEELDDLEQSIEVLKANIDTNVVIIPVNETNEPVESKTIEVGYSIDYLGTTQNNLLPTIIYPDNSHTPPHGYTGITTDLTVDKMIKFTVTTGTAIQNSDNKYTFKWSKTVDGTTYEVTKTIVVSTLSTEAEQNVIISDTAPSDTSMLWYDSINNQLKRYDEDEVKIYYTYDNTTKTYIEYVGDRTGNPHTLGLYEIKNDEYIITEDEVFDNGWEVVNDYSNDMSTLQMNYSDLNTNVQNYIKNGYDDYYLTTDTTFAEDKEYYESIQGDYIVIPYTDKYELTEDTTIQANKKYYIYADDNYVLLQYDSEENSYYYEKEEDRWDWSIGDPVPTGSFSFYENRKYYTMHNGTEYDVGDAIPANIIYEKQHYKGLQEQMNTANKNIQAQFEQTEKDITAKITTTTNYVDSNVKGKFYYTVGFIATTDTTVQPDKEYYILYNDNYEQLTYDSSNEQYVFVDGDTRYEWKVGADLSTSQYPFYESGYIEYDGDRTGNPHTLGLYEIVNGEYVVTEDEVFDNGLQGQINDIVDYVKFDAETVVTNPITGVTHTGVVTIGKSNMATKLRLSADVLFFDYNDNQVAYIAADGENTKLYIKDAEVTKSINVARSLSIGNFGWTVDTTDGSVTFGKVK